MSSHLGTTDVKKGEFSLTNAIIFFPTEIFLRNSLKRSHQKQPWLFIHNLCAMMSKF
jgi:hypothetical protein